MLTSSPQLFYAIAAKLLIGTKKELIQLQIDKLTLHHFYRQLAGIVEVTLAPVALRHYLSVILPIKLFAVHNYTRRYPF